MYGISYQKNDFYIWVDKGGTGKTSNALGLYYKFNEKGEQYVILTNQTTTILSRVLTLNKNLFFLEPENRSYLSRLICGKIFDLEGHAKDAIVLDVIKNCNNAIVPVIPEYPDIQACIYSILEIRKHNPQAKIIILANKIRQINQIGLIEKSIKKIGDYPICVMNESRALPNMFIEKRSITEMIKSSGLSKWHFDKVDKSFESLYNYLKS